MIQDTQGYYWWDVVWGGRKKQNDRVYKDIFSINGLSDVLTHYLLLISCPLQIQLVVDKVRNL